MMKSSVVSADLKVRDLANLLENYHVLFVQREGVLVGSVTNGDFRRGIAAGASLEDNITQIMNRSPLTVRERDDYKTRLEHIKRLPQGLRYLPVLDDAGQILRIISDKALMTLPNLAVIMAGGLGSRLKSLTSTVPKPMLRIGDKPILQLILEQFRRAGISRFIVSVNYRAEVIKDYFGDGGEFDVGIEYIQETERMGTAGCLSLLDRLPEDPFLVINGDILTDVDPHELLQQHRATGTIATVCLHEYRMNVPYGVIRTQAHQVLAIEEKPSAVYRINAGIYALNPECIAWVPPKQHFDMPALLDAVLRRGLTVGAYPLTGYWVDIGNPEDFQRANHEYRDPLAQEFQRQRT